MSSLVGLRYVNNCYFAANMLVVQEGGGAFFGVEWMNEFPTYCYCQYSTHAAAVKTLTSIQLAVFCTLSHVLSPSNPQVMQRANGNLFLYLCLCCLYLLTTSCRRGIFRPIWCSQKKKCLKELTCSKTTFWTHKVRRTTTELRANHTAGLTCLWWTCVWLSSCRSARLPAQAAPGLLWVCCRSRVRLPLEADTQSWADETLLWMLPRWTPATLCTWADIHTQRIEWNQ